MWYNLQAPKRLFLADVNLRELGNELDQNGVWDQEWFSVVESFIESFEGEKELIQLLCITQLHVENPAETQCFSKSFFRLDKNDRFDEISTDLCITREEYYERLLMQTGETVEAKIRLTFSLDGVKYLFDFLEHSPCAIMQIEDPSENLSEVLNTSSEKLKSVKIVDVSDLSLEELSYQLHCE
jgi:hypothetical protein